MNKHILEGEWNKIKGSAQKKWGKLTDDEIDQIGGETKKLIGEIQAKYGYEYEKARDEVNDWLSSVR